MTWHAEDVLEIHPHDAENRGIREGDRVAVMSRAGETTPARAHHRAGAAGRRLHDVPSPETGANVVTTENSDWATNCPEYKVTAVEVRLTNRVRAGAAIGDCRARYDARARRAGHGIAPGRRDRGADRDHL
jgi:predicted molibdopterin-dependent oxidoreductase YjgC